MPRILIWPYFARTLPDTTAIRVFRDSEHVLQLTQYWYRASESRTTGPRLCPKSRRKSYRLRRCDIRSDIHSGGSTHQWLQSPCCVFMVGISRANAILKSHPTELSGELFLTTNQTATNHLRSSANLEVGRRVACQLRNLSISRGWSRRHQSHSSRASTNSGKLAV